MKISVIIPIYKQEITYSEIISLKQCIRILGDHDIILVTYGGLNLSEYISYFNRVPYRVELFPQHFFKDVSGYNKIMTSVSFYQRFIQYDYILVYQLDAFVFEDELSYWCRQQFDYVGAPWFENHVVLGEDAKLWRVGNGGFSLRKVLTYINCLESKIIFPSFSDLLKSYRAMPVRFKIKKVDFILRRLFKSGGAIRDFVENIEINEDAFWGMLIPRYIKTFNVPDPRIASKFSFECNPRVLYELNQKELPFGCHGWQKYDLEFWKPHIEKFGYEINL
ncbi:MAG: hypothetical protein EPN37_14690 [Chitinophagaceae bacterium]|nr:MAG: hypothetical protein EPN37_14690 [Chitinophagaceae bacterium]